MKVLFENELRVADFHLPSRTCVLYLSECDVIAGTGYRRRLVRYRNVGLDLQLFFCGGSIIIIMVSSSCPGWSRAPGAGSDGDLPAVSAVL